MSLLNVTFYIASGWLSSPVSICLTAPFGRPGSDVSRVARVMGHRVERVTILKSDTAVLEWRQGATLHCCKTHIKAFCRHIHGSNKGWKICRCMYEYTLSSFLDFQHDLFLISLLHSCPFLSHLCVLFSFSLAGPLHNTSKIEYIVRLSHLDSFSEHVLTILVTRTNQH